MSDRLPPIPTPRARAFRQLRLEYLPLAIFIAGLIAAAMIWTRWVAPPSLTGEAEAVRAELRSVRPGTLSGLELDLLQPVKAGQTIGRVIVSDPRVVDASLATIRAEIEAMRTTMDPVVGQQRAAFDFQRLQLDLMSKRVDLATLQGGLNQAETTLARSAGLHRSKIVSDEDYELARNARDTLVAQIKALTELIAEMEPRIVKMDAAGAGADSSIEGLRAAIQHKEAELRLIEAQLSPQPLVAPMDGVITAIFRRAGEAVGSAEPILQISATRTDRLIGFLRQPLPLTPQPGLAVEVRTRGLRRQIGTAQIEQVGRQLEPISPTLLAAMRLPVTTVPTEFGLRVHVSIPAGLSLRPGEHVDIIIPD